MDCEVQREERDQSVDQEAMREIPFGIILGLVVSIADRGRSRRDGGGGGGGACSVDDIADLA